jgi:S-DNA-T family DNA segregation ATPase FtsK/SpoIIIE
MASLVAGTADVRVTTVAMRRSPLRSAPADHLVVRESELEDALAAVDSCAGPQLLVVDDADLVDDHDGRLARLVAARRPQLRIVVGGRADILRSAFGHWTAGIRRSRIGVVLRPHPDLDGDLLQVPLPRGGPTTFPVGRGYLVCDGRVELVQLAYHAMESS